MCGDEYGDAQGVREEAWAEGWGTIRQASGGEEEYLRVEVHKGSSCAWEEGDGTGSAHRLWKVPFS